MKDYTPPCSRYSYGELEAMSTERLKDLAEQLSDDYLDGEDTGAEIAQIWEVISDREVKGDTGPEDKNDDDNHPTTSRDD